MYGKILEVVNLNFGELMLLRLKILCIALVLPLFASEYGKSLRDYTDDYPYLLRHTHKQVCMHTLMHGMIV